MLNISVRLYIFQKVVANCQTTFLKIIKRTSNSIFCTDHLQFMIFFVEKSEKTWFCVTIRLLIWLISKSSILYYKAIFLRISHLSPVKPSMQSQYPIALHVPLTQFELLQIPVKKTTAQSYKSSVANVNYRQLQKCCSYQKRRKISSIYYFHFNRSTCSKKVPPIHVLNALET